MQQKIGRFTQFVTHWSISMSRKKKETKKTFEDIFKFRITDKIGAAGAEEDRMLTTCFIDTGIVGLATSFSFEVSYSAWQTSKFRRRTHNPFVAGSSPAWPIWFNAFSSWFLAATGKASLVFGIWETAKTATRKA